MSSKGAHPGVDGESIGGVRRRPAAALLAVVAGLSLLVLGIGTVITGAMAFASVGDTLVLIGIGMLVGSLGLALVVRGTRRLVLSTRLDGL
jgi:cytochrome c biogenesis protein CcdA